MKIVLKCSCGKVLRLPMDYAGKHGQCPQCGKLNIIPKLTEEESAPINICSCPTCGVYLSEADEVCVSCRTNLKTGEWRAQEIKKKFKIHLLAKKSFWILVTYIVLLGIIAYLWLQINVENKSYILMQQYIQIPQKTPNEMEEKLKKWESIKEQITNLQQVEECNRLLQDKLQQHYYDKNMLEISNKIGLPPLEQVVNLTKINLHYHMSPIKWDHKVENELFTYFNSYQIKIDQLMQEQRYEEIVTRVTPKLLDEILYSLFSVSEAPDHVRETATALINEYKDGKNLSLSKDKSEEKMKSYEENFNLYLYHFYQVMSKRDYEAGQEKLQKFWNDVNSLNYFETENNFIKDVRRKLNDIQAIRNLFHIAQQGAEHSKGVGKKFTLANGDKIVGVIEKYQDGIFTIKNDNGDFIEVNLITLYATDILFFAFRANKHYSTYLYATVFLAYEELHTHAHKALEIASKKGASPQEILFYKDWLDELDNSKQK